MHRRKHAMYADGELHVLCLELALHLLSSPSGMLDPLQLPQDPTGKHQRCTCKSLLDVPFPSFPWLNTRWLAPC